MKLDRSVAASILPTDGRELTPASDTVLAVEDLHVRFVEGGEQLHVVDGVSFTVERASTLAIVGESGSGKSVTARAIMGLLPAETARVDGTARLGETDLIGLDAGALRRLRGRDITLIFQDPMRSLNPTMSVGKQIGESLRVHLKLGRSETRRRAVELLESVRIPSAERRAREYPHQLSGGMRQRVMIAMALACDPKVLIADEPTTALDVTTQAQIMDLLRELQRQFSMAIVLISHDIGLAAEYADHVAVMYAGQIVERASADAIFDHVRMPYTKALFESTPQLGQQPHSLLPVIEGRPPDPSALPEGCRFASRCPYRQPRCDEERPPVVDDENGRAWACWYPL